MQYHLINKKRPNNNQDVFNRCVSNCRGEYRHKGFLIPLQMTAQSYVNKRGCLKSPRITRIYTKKRTPSFLLY